MKILYLRTFANIYYPFKVDSTKRNLGRNHAKTIQALENNYKNSIQFGTLIYKHRDW